MKSWFEPRGVGIGETRSKIKVLLSNDNEKS
jgi:hypothetical protein